MSKRLNLKRRTVATAVVSVLIGLLIGFSYSALAQSPTLSTATITGGPHPGAPNWTVFTEGGYIYAKSASGTISYGPTTNGTAVLEQVLATNPAKVKVGTMTITLTGPLLYGSNLQLEGDGKGNTIFNTGFADYAFKPRSTQTTNVVFNDFTILLTTDSVGQGGLNLDGSSFVSVNRLNITDTSGSKTNDVGIKLKDTNAKGCYFNSFTDIDIRNCKYGYFFADTVGWTANSNSIRGGRVQACTAGVYIEDGNYNWIYNTDFEGNTKAIQLVTGAMNGVNGGDFETNTQDIDIATGYNFNIIGSKGDLITWGGGSGMLSYIGSSYGSALGGGPSVLGGYSTGASYIIYAAPNQASYGAPLKDGAAYGTPGTSYVDFSGYIQTKIDFSSWHPTMCRLFIIAYGDEVGAAKGLAMTYGAGSVLCQATWNGNTLQTLAGSWTDMSQASDLALRLQVKGSSATESIYIYRVELQFK